MRLVPVEERVQALKQDYRDMAVMMFEEAPRFDSILGWLADFERELNSQRQ
jgi:hypothetical protein